MPKTVSAFHCWLGRSFLLPHLLSPSFPSLRLLFSPLPFVSPPRFPAPGRKSHFSVKGSAGGGVICHLMPERQETAPSWGGMKSAWIVWGS